MLTERSLPYFNAFIANNIFHCLEYKMQQLCQYQHTIILSGESYKVLTFFTGECIWQLISGSYLLFYHPHT